MIKKNDPSKAWIAGLDTIRFFLALIVLMGHANILRPLAGIGDNNSIIKLLKAIVENSLVGVAAVIAFFVISGLVIHFPYRNGKQIVYGEFFIKRYLRIGIPMIIVAFIAWLSGVKEDELPFWSLYCELIYYTIYPFLVYVIMRYSIKLTTVIFVAFIISIILLFLHGYDVNVFWSQKTNDTSNYYHLGPWLTWVLGLPCWLLGVKIAQEFDTILLKYISTFKIYLIRVTVLAAATACSVLRFHFAASYTLTMGLFSILAAYWIKSEISFWSNRSTIGMFEAGGKWSYSIYLCHVFPIVYVRSIGGTTSFSIAAIEVAAGLILSYIFYLIVEKPSHLLIKRIHIKGVKK